MIRELGLVNANAHAQAQRTYDARLDLEAIKRALGSKPNTGAAQAKFEEDNALFEAKTNSMNESLVTFGEQVKHAFALVEAVDASFN